MKSQLAGEIKMKVAVLGATGPTGVEVVKQALELGYDVVALVRDPEKLATLVKHDKLKVRHLWFYYPLLLSYVGACLVTNLKITDFF